MGNREGKGSDEIMVLTYGTIMLARRLLLAAIFLKEKYFYVCSSIVMYVIEVPIEFSRHAFVSFACIRHSPFLAPLYVSDQFLCGCALFMSRNQKTFRPKKNAPSGNKVIGDPF